MNENENKPLPDEISEQTAQNTQENNGMQATQPDAASQSVDGTTEQSSASVTDETVPAEPQEPQEQERGTEPTVLYRWDYAAQVAEDTRWTNKTRRNGVLTFAIVMSVCFVLTLLVLIASLISGGLSELSHGDGGLYGDGTLDLSDGQGDALSLQEISAKGNEVVVAVSIRTAMGTGSGTGIIMTEDGYIATNHHVIENATDITVQLYDGSQYEAQLVGSSEIDDLAVLKINKRGLPTAVFGDSSQVSVGDRAVVIGHPAGLEFGWTSTYGFVSAINRDVKIRDLDGTMTKKMTLLQTDANVNSGNSGGPMFNDRGEVIGIITLKLAGDYEGMGFAIPSNGAVPLLEALMRTGTTDGVQSEVSSARPELGITGVSVEKDRYYVLGEDRIYELSEAEAEATEASFKAGETGVFITAVAPRSGSYDKIMAGDIVTLLDGKAVYTTTEMREILYDKSVGDTIEVTLVRNGEQITVSVQLKAAAN